MINKIKSLIRRKSSCVLATTDRETPHCSLMAYIISENAERLFLVTPRNTRKYRNIKRNPHVSLLIDTRGEQTRVNTQALTVTGTCYILEDDEEIQTVMEAFSRNHSHLNDFISRGDIAFLRVEFDSFLYLDGPENAHHETFSVNPRDRYQINEGE
jgi:nitroimidazol reductase NimA-like FMN-containing flavoprotein (pyridoxamine 5'-phosphate oxidase superfamily)